MVGIGVDTPSLDPGNSSDFLAHVNALQAGLYGVENLANLGTVPPVGTSVTVHVKVVVPVWAGEPLSVARTVTLEVPDAVGVPVMMPVVAAMLSPAGRPVAAYVSVWPASGSLAAMVSGVIAVPRVLDRLPGFVTVGAWLPPPPVVRSTTRPDRLVEPPDEVTATVPLVMFTSYGPSRFQVPAGPLTMPDATVAPLRASEKVALALSSHVYRLTR